MHLIGVFSADFLGFSTYPPAYLSREAEGTNLLTGANFASGASGFYDNTAKLYVSYKNLSPSYKSIGFKYSFHLTDCVLLIS